MKDRIEKVTVPGKTKTLQRATATALVAFVRCEASILASRQARATGALRPSSNGGTRLGIEDHDRHDRMVRFIARGDRQDGGP